MSWARIKATTIRRFFEELNKARVESIVRYFNTRADLRRKHDWRSDFYDISDHSAFPYAGLTKRGKVDQSVYEGTAKLLPSVAVYFDFNSPLDLGRFVNSVVSCAASTRELSQGPRAGNTKNQIIKAVERLKLEYKRINDIFRTCPEIRYAFREVTRRSRYGYSRIV